MTTPDGAVHHRRCPVRGCLHFGAWAELRARLEAAHRAPYIGPEALDAVAHLVDVAALYLCPQHLESWHSSSESRRARAALSDFTKGAA